MKVKSALNWPTEYVKCFAYGVPRSGKTHLGGTFPDPIWLDFEDGLMTIRRTIMDLGKPDVPILTPTSWGEVVAFAMNPVRSVENALKGTPFEGYQFKSIIVDTVSTMEDLCFTKILGDEFAGPEISDYKTFGRQMRPFFAQMWKLPYNVCLLAHTYHGGIEIKDKKTGTVKPAAPPGPLLSGAIREQGPGLSDFYLHLYTELIGSRVLYYADATMRDGYPAGVRGVADFFDKRVTNPNYQQMRDALDKLENLKKKGGENV